MKNPNHPLARRRRALTQLELIVATVLLIIVGSLGSTLFVHAKGYPDTIARADTFFLLIVNLGLLSASRKARRSKSGESSKEKES